MMGRGRSMLGKARDMAGRSMVGRGRSHQQEEALRPRTEYGSRERGMTRNRAMGIQQPPAAEVLGADSDPVLFPLGPALSHPYPRGPLGFLELAISPVTLGGTQHGFILVLRPGNLACSQCEGPQSGSLDPSLSMAEAVLVALGLQP